MLRVFHNDSNGDVQLNSVFHNVLVGQCFIIESSILLLFFGRCQFFVLPGSCHLIGKTSRWDDIRFEILKWSLTMATVKVSS